MKIPGEKIEESTTLTKNESCIITMGLKAGEKENDFAILHFSPGDALSSIQKKVINWSGSPHSGCIFKLSHHGDKMSTPPAVIDTLKPGCIVIPAGLNNTHGHPAWETMVYLGVYREDMSRRAKNSNDDPVPEVYMLEPQFNISGDKYWTYAKTNIVTNLAKYAKDRALGEFGNALNTLDPAFMKEFFNMASSSLALNQGEKGAVVLIKKSFQNLWWDSTGNSILKYSDTISIHLDIDLH